MRYALFALALAFVTTPALAATWEDWDANGDGDITEEEWDESFAGSSTFDDWDVDGDGVINESEYSTGLFGTFDANDDGDITEEEWEQSFDVENVYDGWYDAWDVNDDGVLDSNEFSAGLYDYYDANDNGVFDEQEWDKNFDLDRTHNSRYAGWDINNDGTLDEQEFSSGMFERYDANDNDTVTAEEWHTATPLDI